MKDGIRNSIRLNLGFLRNLLSVVPEDKMTTQPPGLPNHPAWTLGHLVHSFQAIGEELGVEPWLDDGWETKFGTGSKPVEDGANYPARDELLAAVEDGAERIGRQLDLMSFEDFAAPLPDARYREVFPTVGEAATHILCAHFSFHIGQLTCWIRTTDLPIHSEMDER